MHVAAVAFKQLKCTIRNRPAFPFWLRAVAITDTISERTTEAPTAEEKLSLQEQNRNKNIKNRDNLWYSLMRENWNQVSKMVPNEPWTHTMKMNNGS